MKAVIIEDEIYNANRLVKLIAQIDDNIRVLAVLESVGEAMEWFMENQEPDIIFADINLSDGLSFEIFANCNIECPIIFTTAYNEYAIDALKLNSIDYLLKPIDIKELQRSIQKFHNYQNNEVIQNLIKYKNILNGLKSNS